MNELYLLFFQSAIAMFDNFNRFLQREDTVLFLMNAQMEVFTSMLAAIFVKPDSHGTQAGGSLSVGMITKGKIIRLCYKQLYFIELFRNLFIAIYNFLQNNESHCNIKKLSPKKRCSLSCQFSKIKNNVNYLQCFQHM